MTADMPADVQTFQMMWHNTWCLAILSGVFLQTMAWSTWASAKTPHRHLCDGTHRCITTTTTAAAAAAATTTTIIVKGPRV